MITANKTHKGLFIKMKGISRLNLNNAGKLFHKVRRAVHRDGHNVFLDMDGIRFIDSTGFTTLLKIKEMLHEKDKELYLLNVSEEVRELLQLLKLDRELQFMDSEYLWPEEKL